MMGGWTRLWIVVSIVLAIPTGLVAHDSYQRIRITEAPFATAGEARAWARQTLQHCADESVFLVRELGEDRYELMGSCENSNAWAIAIIWAAAPGFLLLIIGLTISWIYRGFRPKE